MPGEKDLVGETIATSPETVTEELSRAAEVLRGLIRYTRENYTRGLLVDLEAKVSKLAEDTGGIQR